MSKKLKSSGAKSPFLCKDVQNIDKLLEANEEDEIFAWWNYEVFMERLDETFTSAIPSEDIRAMPAKYRYPIGILLVLSLVALLIDLIYTAYTVARNTQYLSPLDGDTASANCEAITTTNSGNYLFSFTGYWQGSTGFEYAQASFELLLTSYSSTTSNFNAGMDSLYSGISNLGTYMKTYDLSINILVWTSYAILIETNNTANRFVMSGDPVVVFDRQHVTVSSMSIHGICNITAATGFDYATGSLYVTYPYKEYMNHPVCNETFNPLYAGYVPGLTEDTIDLAIDVRSLVTAIAVNINLISFDQLVEIEAYRDLIEYANVPYIVSMYYDPKYVGMSPISCIQNLNHTVRQCLLTPNNRLYAIPILNHFGNSTEFPQKCDCNILLKSPPEEYGNCNLFNFLAGFIFWNNNNANGFFELVIKQGSLFTINNLAYNASYISSYFGQRSSQSAELRSLHSIKKSLEFCNVASYGYCSIMSFSAFDSAPWTFAVSPYYYQLSYGACNDSVTPTEDAW